jgi:hypothetical protein
MAEMWYVTHNTPTGQHQAGPMPFEQLQQMAANGQLAPIDVVFQQGTANWVPASSVPALAQYFPVGQFRTPYPEGMPRPKSSAGTVVVIVLVVVGVMFLGCCVLLAAISTVGTNASAQFSNIGSKLGGS